MPDTVFKIYLSNNMIMTTGLINKPMLGLMWGRGEGGYSTGGGGGGRGVIAQGEGEGGGGL